MRDRALSEVIARKMARIHKLTVPISKENVWLSNVLNKYAREAEAVSIASVAEGSKEMARKLLNFDFDAEIKWLL